MEIRYQLTPDDFLNAMRVARSSFFKWLFRILSLFAIALVFVELYLLVFLASNERAQNAALNLRPLVIFLVIWVVFVTLMPRFSARSQFRGTPVANLPVTLTASDEGLRFRTPASEASINWSAFAKFIEGKDVFVHYASAKAFGVIPKRAFTPEELRAFRELVKSKVGKFQTA
jgi:hypothetical protein